MDINKRQEAIDVATAVVNKSLHPIEGCRRLVSLQHDLDMSDDDSFIAISGIESETDHWPLGAQKQNCSTSYLKQMENEESEYLESALDDILQACNEIIGKLNK